MEDTTEDITASTMETMETKSDTVYGMEKLISVRKVV